MPRTPTRTTHPPPCAHQIRLRWLSTAGDPDPPGPVLLADIAEDIATCCHHTLLKAYRLAHGWTVAAAVQAVHDLCATERLGARGLSERSWKEWEAGARVSPDYQDLLCRVFHTGPVQLGLAADYSPPVDNSDPMRGPDRLPEAAPTGWGGMLRRTMQFGSAAITALIGTSVSAQDQTCRSGQVNPDTVADLHDIAAGYRRAYRAAPAAQLLPAAHAHLELALSLKPALQPEPLGQVLVTVAGEMAALVGALLCLDHGQPGLAAPYLDLAWKAARASASPELQAVVLGCRSFAAAYGSGDHRTGLEFADLGHDIAAGGACAETRAWVAAVASERCASLGDYDGCRTRLDRARTALEDPDDLPWCGIGGFNADKLLAYEGGDLVRLRRYRDAEPILDAAIDHLDESMHRHRGTALIDRADARLAADEVDAACADATEALQLVAAVQHAGNLARIETTARAAAATGAHAGRDLWRDVMLAKADHALPTMEAP